MDFTQNKTKISIAIVVLAIIVIVVIMMLGESGTPTVDNNPAVTTGLQGEANQLSTDINDATKFDNEADLKTIDSQFQ